MIYRKLRINRQNFGSVMKTPVGVARYPCFTFSLVCKIGRTVFGVNAASLIKFLNTTGYSLLKYCFGNFGKLR
jgi:hypothetical protein